MKLHPYKDYDEYRDSQIKANCDKLKYSWVRPETINFICDVIRANIPAPKFGLCHGTRRGLEQILFMKALPECRVLGTEISHTAKYFPHTVQLDFHVILPEWEFACDFVYTNSLDHSYNPEVALKQWLKCLNDTGILIIEWTDKIGKRIKQSNPVDPFAGTTEEVCNIITECGGAIFKVHPMTYGKSKESSSKAQVSLIFARASK